MSVVCHGYPWEWTKVSHYFRGKVIYHSDGVTRTSGWTSRLFLNIWLVSTCFPLLLLRKSSLCALYSSSVWKCLSGKCRRRVWIRSSVISSDSLHGKVVLKLSVHLPQENWKWFVWRHAAISRNKMFG